MSKRLPYLKVHRNKKPNRLPIQGFSKRDYFEINLYELLIKNDIYAQRN